MNTLPDENILENLDSFQIVDIIKGLSDEEILQILHDRAFIEKYKLTQTNLRKIVLSLGENAKITLLLDEKEFITGELHFNEVLIVELTTSLSDENAKLKVLENYKLKIGMVMNIIKTLSDQNKVKILLEEKYNFSNNNEISILQQMKIDELCRFMKENREFCIRKDIHPFDIVRGLDAKRQLEFLSRMEDINLTLSEKKEILVTLKNEVKQGIDTSGFPEEYKVALDIPTTEGGGLIALDLSRNLEDYRGLDNLIMINPEKFTKEQRDKLMQLCEICPNFRVCSTLKKGTLYPSKSSEYREGEIWIASVLESLGQEYSTIQKIALIDSAIGKKISYSPDFGTEVFDMNSRALWRTISSGYGICSGISKIEQYMLDRIGVESEIISSETHVFLKLKDIELPLANGNIVRGNTILDPTWNLANHRFGTRPNNFCISYRMARKNDIIETGEDTEAHKNDEALEDATLGLDDQSLRKIFISVGLADKDGQFLAKDMVMKSKALHKLYANQPEQNIREQFLLLAKTCPEFATCINSTIKMLSGLFLNDENLKFNKCTVNRVYSKDDKDKRPVLYVYIDSNELGKRFYYADKESGQFVELAQEEFTKRFECYEADMKRNKRT